MNMAQESSVLISLQQLLDEEQVRQRAELAEQQAQLVREREAQQRELAAEAARAERIAQLAREEESRLEAARQAALLTARLTAEAELERARQQAEVERSSLLVSQELTRRTVQRLSRSRILVAGLTVLLGGAIAIGGWVIIPGQQRANQAYSRLQQQHASFAEQAGQRESVLMHQVQDLRDELERAQFELAAAATASAPKPGVRMIRHPTPQTAVPNTRKPACSCLASDPLCDCFE